MRILLAILLSAITASAANLLPNSSFEAGAGRGWITWGNSGGSYAGNTNDIKGCVTNIAGAPHGGNAYLVLPGSKQLSRVFWLQSGTYSVSWSARRETGSGSTSASLDILNGEELSTVFPYLVNFSVSDTTWTRFTNSFTAASNAFYMVGFSGQSSGGGYAARVLVDALQVETNTATDYAPAAAVEAGISIPATNNIYFSGDTKTFNLNFWNTGTASNITARYEIYDLWNRQLVASNITVALNAATNTTQSVNLPATNGWLRIVTRLPQVTDSIDEAAVAVYPHTLSLDAATDADWLGGEPNSSPYASDLETKKNRKWWRNLSASSCIRWSTLEPTSGNFNWTDADPTIAGLMSGGRKGLIPLTGSDTYWQSSSVNWATNGDGTASLNAYSNYCWQVVNRYNVTLGYSNSLSYEVWNEPYQSGPTGPLPINMQSAAGYLSVLQTAIQAITNAHPSAKIIAMGGSVGNVEWVWQVWTNLTAGEKAAITAVSVHEYAGNGEDPNLPPVGTSALPQNWMTKFRGIVPVWNTESGWYMRSQGKSLNNAYPNYTLWWSSPSPESARDESVLRQRVETMRGMDIALKDIGEGYARFFYYDSRQWNEAAFDNNSSYGYAADQLWVDKPDKVALSVASRAITAPGLGRITNSIVNIYQFTNTSGEPVIAAWAYNRTNATITTTNGEFATRDIYWNQLGTNETTLTIESVPRYFHSGTLSLATLSNIFSTATIAAASDTVAPYTTIDVAPTAPWSGSTESVYVRWSPIDNNYAAYTTTDNGTHTNVQTKWKLDSGSYSEYAMSNHVWLSNLSAGDHTFRVTARDRAGNEREAVYYFGGSAPSTLNAGTLRIAKP